VVVGAGPAGEVAAGRLAEAGLRTAMVESELVGGECAFWACMPSKALLRPHEALVETWRVPGAAEAADGQLDVAATLARRDEVIHGLDDAEQLPWLEDRNIELVRGHGRLQGERRVRVGDRVLEAGRAVILAVGTGASLPPIPGLAQASPWTNREVTTSDHIPPRLLVLGGGVVGCEMAQAYATLGSRVTLIEAEPGLLGREEPFAGEQVRDALSELGVEVHLSTKATAVHRDAAGVTVAREGGEPLEGDELLVSVGRRSRTEDLGLETVGLEPGKPVAVDDQLRVDGHPWLYAVGDVNGRALLTHAGKYQARVASEVIQGREARAQHDGAGSPRVVFTDPQVAAVGLTLADAQKAALPVVAIDAPSSASAGASFHGRDQPGTARLVIDRERRVVVGATFTGPEVGEWLHAATIAVVGEVPLDLLWHAIPSFPTRSEVWLKLAERWEKELG